MMEVREEQFDAEEVTGLVMDIDCAEILLETTDADAQVRMTVELDADTQYSSSVKDGKLSVHYRKKTGRRHIHRENGPHITLALPENKAYEELVLRLGAGNADMSRAALCSDRVAIETGAGEIKAGSLYAGESVALELGAGNIALGDVHAKKVKAECGAGHFELCGRVEQELDIDCGLGSCGVHLEGKETDYNYEVECGMGKVSVNGSSMNGMAGRHRQNHPDAAGHIRISCGLGKVDLKIAENQ